MKANASAIFKFRWCFGSSCATSLCISLIYLFDQRLEYLLIEYGNLPADKLIDAAGRIRKRLGGLEAKHATGFLEANDLRGAYAILLRYYDKYYEKALANRPPEHTAITKISAADTNAEVNYRLLEELLNGHQKH